MKTLTGPAPTLRDFWLTRRPRTRRTRADLAVAFVVVTLSVALPVAHLIWTNV